MRDADLQTNAVIAAIRGILLGVLVAAFAGAVYYGLEWAWRDYDDHDRGMWEGLALVYTIALGHAAAKRIARKTGP